MSDQYQWYDIHDDLGNWAEAQGVESARVAARTLIEDGAVNAKIFKVGGRFPVEVAEQLPGGQVRFTGNYARVRS